MSATTSQAFAEVAPWMPVLLAVAVFFFAYSTLCSWGFYGLQAWGYLVGEGPKRDATYRAFYILTIPFGTILSVEAVFNLVDSAFFLMAIPNVIAIYIFGGEVRRDILDYHARNRAARLASRQPQEATT